MVELVPNLLRQEMARLAEQREWERLQKQRLEDERLARMNKVKTPTPPQGKKRSGRSLFRDTKPMPAEQLPGFLESAAFSVFGDDSSLLPASITITGHPDTLKVPEYRTSSLHTPSIKYVKR